MKIVLVFMLCLLLIPAVMTADNVRGAHFIKCPYPAQERVSDMFGARDGWLTVDDGSPSSAVAWDSAGDGAGVGYMVLYECAVGSIMVHMGYDWWPDPGDTLITLRIYDNDTTYCRGDTNRPGVMTWQRTDFPVNRGQWNTAPVIPQQSFSSDTNRFYPFLIQQGKFPNCPSFSYDGGCNYPAQSWTLWQLGGGFFNENPNGDWMIRTFVYSSPGVGEWLSHTPIEPELMVTTITKGISEVRFTLADPMHVELLVYDIIGRERMTIVSQHYSAGTHVVKTQLDLPEGVYFYNLKTDTGFNIAKKFIIVQ